MAEFALERFLQLSGAIKVDDLDWDAARRVGITAAEVLSASLYTRFRSRQEHTFAEKVLSAMRQKFGGHVERPTGN